MRIGSWDVAEADARQWQVTPGFHQLNNQSEWVRGSPLPALTRSDIGMCSLDIKLLIKAQGGRQAILSRCGEILSRLTVPVELTLDHFKHKFFGVLTKYSHEETAPTRWHVLKLSFEGYSFDEEMAASGNGTEMEIYNPGNLLTPVIVELTPQIGQASVVLSGICRDPATGEDIPVTVRELTTEKTVIINGETGLITESGELKAKDVEIWTLPALLPGENNISLSYRMGIKLRFRPRYMEV